MKLQKEMLEIVEILNQVESTNARNEKIEILSDNRENKLLQKVFLYAYSPYKIYGLGKKSLEGVEGLGVTFIQSRFTDIFELLDYLQTVNVNDEIRSEVVSFLMTTPLTIRSLYIKMILKDLRIGATATIANRIWKGLVPKFELMQGKRFEDYEDKIKGKTIAISVKYDGTRLVIIKENGKIKILSRQGKPILGCKEIEKEAEKLPDNYIYDGEVLKVNPEKLSSKDLFIETRKIMGSKGAKKGLEYYIFDALPLKEFEQGQSKLNFLDRKQFLPNLIDEGSFNYFKNVPILYVGKDLGQVDILLKQAIENKQEGLMLNLNRSYECKRSNNLLKVKKFYTFDGRITGVYEGEGKYTNMLGGVFITYKDITVKVGSGFSDSEREIFYSDTKLIVGKIAECKYFEESEDKDGNLNLRFATWERLREDKNEVSYN